MNLSDIFRIGWEKVEKEASKIKENCYLLKISSSKRIAFEHNSHCVFWILSEKFFS